MKQIVSAVRRVLGSVLYMGFIPMVPGTVVSLFVVLLLWLFRFQVDDWFALANIPHFSLYLVAYIVIASWICDDAKENFGHSVPQQIVFDEIGGQLFTFLLVTHVWGVNVSVLALGFVVYRFFSIVKPWPIHHFEEVTGGIGLVVDDLAAGAMSALFLHALIALHHYIMPIIS